MHFFTERLLGGFGIVGGQIPIATGAAFTIQISEEPKIQTRDILVSSVFSAMERLRKGHFMNRQSSLSLDLTLHLCD